MLRYAFLFFVLCFAVNVVHADQCVEPHVDNATFVVTQEAASETFDGSETITATTVDNGVCAGKKAAKSDSAFAFPIFSDDEVITPDVVDGAKNGESFYLESDGKSVLATFQEDPDVPIQKTSTTYQDGAIYFASSVEKLATDSSQIGFETDTLYTASDTAEVGMNVTLPEADTLSGVQFDLVFDGPQPVVSKPHNKGTLNTNLIGEDTLRVLLYSGTSGDVLPKQNVLKVNTEVTSSGQTLDITAAVASLRESGSVVEVSLSPGTSPIFIQEGTTDLVVQTNSVSFSETVVGNQTQSPITVENQGTVQLSLSTESDNTVFSVSGGPFTVLAGESKDVSSMFAPERTKFGDQSGNIELFTNTDTSSVSADGQGVGGRGDPTLNGTVDVSDVVKTADIILGIGNPSQNENEAADVYPIDSEGNETVNITDLQTTASAILSDSWGDGEPLSSSAVSSSKTATTASGPQSDSPSLVLKEREEKTTVFVKGAAEARGIQFDIETTSTVSTANHENIKVQSGEPSLDVSRFLVYRTDGESLSKDSLTVGTVDNNELESIEVADATLSGSDYSNSDLDVTKRELVQKNSLQVRPNPFRENTTVEVRLTKKTDGRLEVYDVLGRRVGVIQNGDINQGKNVFNVDAKDFSSGMYFIRLRSEVFNKTKKMVVIR